MKKTTALIFTALALMFVTGCGNNKPSPIALTFTSNSPIMLSWNSIPGVTSYQVLRGLATSSMMSVATVSDTSYAETAATTTLYTTYYYQVIAVNSAGSSFASSILAITSQPPVSGPLVLNDPTITAPSQVTLSWSNINGAVGYNVYRGTASGIIASKTLLTPAGITPTTYIDTPTTSTVGTQYYYQVTAVNAYGYEFLVSSEKAVTF
jgi:hypothetical protein